MSESVLICKFVLFLNPPPAPEINYMLIMGGCNNKIVPLNYGWWLIIFFIAMVNNAMVLT